MPNTIYDIDFTKVAPALMPPDKRYSKMIAWLKVLLTPIQYLRDLWFGSYRTGSTDAPWSGAVTYAKYNRVIYNRAVYESLVSGNINNAPTNTAYWVQVQTIYIGLEEILKYTGNKLVLEYALNKWFQTSFRQPPGVSDIYFTTNSVQLNAFVIGKTESASSTMFTNRSTEYIINNYSFASFYNANLMVPSALISALAPTSAAAFVIISSVVDQILPNGIKYQIIPY